MERQQVNFAVIVLASAIFLCSCSCKQNCSTSAPVLGNEILLYNFNTTELDSIVVKLYQSGSNFTNPFDSGVYKSNGPSGEYSFNYNNNNPSLSASSLNILVYFPNDGLSYRVTNITTGVEVCPQCSSVNLNVVTGYSVNGVSSGALNTNYISITK